MAVAYGTIAIVPKGVWNAGTEYNVGHLVELDGSSYVAKAKPPVGTLPTNTAYWQVSATGTSKATADNAGVVKPDGVTTKVDENAALSVKTAQQNAVGVVKGSAGIKVGADGSLDVNTEFEQAATLANIIAGEAIAQVLGKVSKAIATTMNLDQNALLKNMLTGIDVNDANKVPNAAFIHTLVERIGMGADLGYGFANLTAGLNSVKKGLDDTNSNFGGFKFVRAISSGLADRLWISNVAGTFALIWYGDRGGGTNGEFNGLILVDATQSKLNYSIVNGTHFAAIALNQDGSLVVAFDIVAYWQANAIVAPSVA